MEPAESPHWSLHTLFNGRSTDSERGHERSGQTRLIQSMKTPNLLPHSAKYLFAELVFHKVRLIHVLLSTALGWNTFHCAPCALNFVCVRTSHRVLEVETVVYCENDKSLFINAVACLPAIRYGCSPRLYPVFDYWYKGVAVCFVCRTKHWKTVFSVSVDSPKHPMALDPPPLLSFSKLTLVNFDYMIVPTYSLIRIRQNNFTTNVSTELLPVTECLFWSNSQFLGYRFQRRLYDPEINKQENSPECLTNMSARKKEPRLKVNEW